MELYEFLKIILDKGLLALLLIIFGLWANRLLANYKSTLDLKRNTEIMLAESRLPAFTSLWALTESTSPTRTKTLNKEEKNTLNLSLRAWYYENGNGLFLTNNLRKTYLAARKALEGESPESEDKISKVFSKLRTDLKNEIGIYGYFEEE